MSGILYPLPKIVKNFNTIVFMGGTTAWASIKEILLEHDISRLRWCNRELCSAPVQLTCSTLVPVLD